MFFRNTVAFVCASAVLISSVATVAQAATVQADGVSLVNSGKGFNRISGSEDVLPGDVVVVKSGKAKIYYSSGCVEEIPAGKTYKIQAENACVVSPNQAPAAAAGIAPEVLIGGALVAGGIVAAVASSHSNSKSSP